MSIDIGIFDYIDTMKNVEKLKLLVSRENPKWIICDAGYGKTKNQILMRHYPGRIWSAFTNSDSNIPIWNTINEINGIPLPEEDWKYHVSVNHTAMCRTLKRYKQAESGNILLPGACCQNGCFFLYLRFLRLMLKKSRPLPANSESSRLLLHMCIQPSHTLCFHMHLAQDYTEAGYNLNVMTRATGRDDGCPGADILENKMKNLIESLPFLP